MVRVCTSSSISKSFTVNFGLALGLGHEKDKIEMIIEGRNWPSTSHEWCETLSELSFQCITFDKSTGLCHKSEGNLVVADGSGVRTQEHRLSTSRCFWHKSVAIKGGLVGSDIATFFLSLLAASE